MGFKTSQTQLHICFGWNKIYNLTQTSLKFFKVKVKCLEILELAKINLFQSQFKDYRNLQICKN